MGRTPLPSAISHVDMNEELVRADLAAIDALPAALAAIEKNTAAMAKRLAYDGALTIESLEEEIKFYQRRSVEAVLETGKRLLLLKEIAGHGGFMERLDALGIGQSLANKLMAATLKFSNSESTTILGLPNLNQGKLLELLALDDGEIEALNSGDSVRGIVLDDVDCMSVSELRRALRSAQANTEAATDKAKEALTQQLQSKDEVLAGKQKLIELQAREIDGLSERARFVAVATPTQKLEGIRTELLAHAAGIEGALAGKLKPAFAALKEHLAAHGGECDAYLSSSLGQIERAVREIREEFGLLREEDVEVWANAE